MKYLRLTILLIFLVFNVVGCNNRSIVDGAANPPGVQTDIPLSPTLPAETTKGTGTSNYSGDLNAAETAADFKMRLPANLPENYVFRSTVYIPEQQAITVQYIWDHPDFTGEMLFLTQQRLEPTGDIDKEAVIEAVQIGSSPAVFVQGGKFDGNWEKDAPVFRLRWEMDDLYYTVLFTGNERTSSGFLTKEEMVLLAEQLQ